MAKKVYFDDNLGIEILRGKGLNYIPNELYVLINDFSVGSHSIEIPIDKAINVLQYLKGIPFSTIKPGITYYSEPFFSLKMNNLFLHCKYNTTDHSENGGVLQASFFKNNELNEIGRGFRFGSISYFEEYNFYYFFTKENNFAIVFTNTTAEITSYRVGFSYVVFDKNIYGAPVNVKSVPNSSGAGGYNGDYDDTSDTIVLPKTPNIGVSNIGFVNVYKIDVNGLQNLGSELFPNFEKIDPFVPSVTDNIAQAIIDVGNGLSNIALNIPNIVNMYINNNLINYVLDCHILPVEPTTTGSEKIKIGFKEFSQSGNKISSDYVTFDCGTLSIKEFFGTFLDYSPFTRCKMFLPFIGYVELEEEFFQNGAINVTYRFNIIDGSFTCFVISTSGKSKLCNSIVKQFGGNCCVHIPLTGLNYSNTVSGIVASASGFLASSGNIATTAISSALNVASSKPNMQSSNSYNATTSFLGVRYPYLIIERIVPQYSENYTKEKGITTEITTDFSNIKGFTIAKDLHFDNILCTESEKDMISELFKKGVIL